MNNENPKREETIEKERKEKGKTRKAWEDPQVIELFDINEEEMANFTSIWK